MNLMKTWSIRATKTKYKLTTEQKAERLANKPMSSHRKDCLCPNCYEWHLSKSKSFDLFVDKFCS